MFLFHTGSIKRRIEMWTVRDSLVCFYSILVRLKVKVEAGDVDVQS